MGGNILPGLICLWMGRDRSSSDWNDVWEYVSFSNFILNDFNSPTEIDFYLFIDRNSAKVNFGFLSSTYSSGYRSWEEKIVDV